MAERMDPCPEFYVHIRLATEVGENRKENCSSRNLINLAP